MHTITNTNKTKLIIALKCIKQCCQNSVLALEDISNTQISIPFLHPSGVDRIGVMVKIMKVVSNYNSSNSCDDCSTQKLYYTG